MLSRRETSIVAAALLALTPTPAAAQPAVAFLPHPVPRASRLTLDGFVSQYRLSVDGLGRTRLPALGGVLLWGVGLPAGHSQDGVARAAVGPFITHAAGDESSPEAWHYGLQGDLRLFARPLAERVDPLLSLGVGELRTTYEEREPLVVAPSPWSIRRLLAPEVRPLVLAAPVTRRVTRTAISPGIGARFLLAPGLALRSDLRDVVLPQSSQRHNLALSAGLSLAL